MRFEQYPYRLQIKKIQGGGQNENGDFIPAVEIFEEVAICRDQANISGRQLKLNDGTAVIYDSIIHTPKGTQSLPIGTVVRVVDRDGKVRVEGGVIRSHEGQLHTRIWL